VKKAIRLCLNTRGSTTASSSFGSMIQKERPSAPHETIALVSGLVTCIGLGLGLGVGVGFGVWLVVRVRVRDRVRVWGEGER
jgi:hypothetical protein